MSTNDTDRLPFVKMAPKETSLNTIIIITHVNKLTERSEQNVVPRFTLSVSEHSCRYYNITSDRVLFLTEISVFLSMLLPKFIDWVLIMKWSNDSLWLMSYAKYFDHEMVEWYHMENILTTRWSNDFIRHHPYNETWSFAQKHLCRLLERGLGVWVVEGSVKVGQVKVDSKVTHSY